jgi:hypothetical protein
MGELGERGRNRCSAADIQHARLVVAVIGSHKATPEVGVGSSAKHPQGWLSSRIVRAAQREPLQRQQSCPLASGGLPGTAMYADLGIDR